MKRSTSFRLSDPARRKLAELGETYGNQTTAVEVAIDRLHTHIGGNVTWDSESWTQYMGSYITPSDWVRQNEPATPAAFTTLLHELWDDTDPLSDKEIAWASEHLAQEVQQAKESMPE